MPRRDRWTPEEIARVRRLRAENPGLTWNGIHRDSNRALRNSLAAENSSGGDQTAEEGSSAAPTVVPGDGATSTAEPEAVSQRVVETEEQEPGLSHQSVTDAGSTLGQEIKRRASFSPGRSATDAGSTFGQERKRRASSSPAGEHPSKRVKSAEDGSLERVASGEAGEGSGLAGNPDTEGQEPVSPVEQVPRSRSVSEPIPFVENGQAARGIEDANSVGVIDLVESDVDTDSGSESSDSSVWLSETDDETGRSDTEFSPPPPGYNPSTSTTSTNSNPSTMSNNHTFSYEGSTINFIIGGSIVNTQAMTNNIVKPDMRRQIMKDLAARPRSGVTNDGSQATQAPSSFDAEKSKNKMKKTAHSQTAVDPEVALPAMWAMIDAQIEQSRMLAGEIRKMRKLTTSILEQASQETQVKREH
ncbi:hypothetical protein BDW42DRAFT_196886 [Aspergillus taichungensis]|uniref:Uncharacterized protein n=1 Tax=Aspergillus taichungensis TaxID=482145 RepID=A0A2J5HII6_9EURO|nr:hypothetical protein BDW42DRAFT_196886 [Aspergillus taichungensis]